MQFLHALYSHLLIEMLPWIRLEPFVYSDYKHNNDMSYWRVLEALQYPCRLQSEIHVRGCIQGRPRDSDSGKTQACRVHRGGLDHEQDMFKYLQAAAFISA